MQSSCLLSKRIELLIVGAKPMVKVLCISLLYVSNIDAKQFNFLKLHETQEPVTDKITSKEFTFGVVKKIIMHNQNASSQLLILVQLQR